MKLRSLLYVPAHREVYLEQAADRGADALILDLEDAVPPRLKLAARERLRNWIPSFAAKGQRVLVRINADTAEADAEAACGAGADGLVVPKVGSAAALEDLVVSLDRKGLGPAPMIALIEDAAALLEAKTIAGAAGLVGLALGGEDFAASIGAEPIPEVLTLPKLMVHYAAKARGLMSFGLLLSTAEYRDSAVLAAAAAEARRHGFDGATCVHPSAVPMLNAAFELGEDDIERARRMIHAMETAEAEGRGAVLFEGRMLDAASLANAQKLINRSQRDPIVQKLDKKP